MVIAQINQTNNNWIQICFLWFQQNASSTSIYPISNTPTDAQLTSIINYAKSVGLKTVLRPGINCQDGEWRGEIGKNWNQNSNEWNLWFTNYTAMMTKYAKLAQELNVDMMSVGFEYSSLIKETEKWINVINEIKKYYKGPLRYDANWGNENRVEFWNELDYIGIDAYYPLDASNDNPTVSDLVKAWQPLITDFKNLSATYNNKKIIFAEIGYCSTNGANKNPAFCGSTLNIEAQTNCYQAFFDAIYKQSFLQGVFWWDWATDPGNAGLQNKAFTPNGKPAANLCKQYFS